MTSSDQPHDLQESAIAFARQALNYDVISADAAEAFNLEAWRHCADFGVLGMPIPKEYGGLGLGLSALLAVMEGLGYGTRDQGLLFSLNAHLWTNSIPILRYGTEAQRQRYLPGLCDGSLIGANAASEPDAGSDIFSMRTRAVARRQRYVLTGTKMFVTNAPVADLFVAYATIDPALGATGITAFIIERETPGLTVSRKLHKMGLRTSPMAEVIFEDCRVPVAPTARPRRPRRRGVRVLDGVGARVHSRQLPRRHAAAARGVHPARPDAEAVRPADRQEPVGGQPDRGHEGPARDAAGRSSTGSAS